MCTLIIKFNSIVATASFSSALHHANVIVSLDASGFDEPTGEQKLMIVPDRFDVRRTMSREAMYDLGDPSCGINRS